MVKQSKAPAIERRVLPRCSIDTSVDLLINSQGTEMQFQTKSSNISLRGIELACNDELIQAILAQKTYPHLCKISFKLPGYEKAFEIHTQVVTHRRLSQHNYQLVLLFINMSKAVEGKLLNELASFRVMTTHNETRTALAV
jgi:c-di-GMP-binding flagellar brake protein YcgR